MKKILGMLLILVCTTAQSYQWNLDGVVKGPMKQRIRRDMTERAFHILCALRNTPVADELFFCVKRFPQGPRIMLTYQ